ncbi:TonB-dependent receptor plug domain-containing protein [Pseudoalteromonas sp. T1lg65]|uniref:TonB-dependent receptor plug domain-containing protein n=1 Tax=Pseudoalteromonas sp. T1lg65 TaxID=2077101 RepID=UPI003F78F948
MSLRFFLLLFGCFSSAAYCQSEQVPELEELLSKQLNQVPKNIEQSTASRIERSSGNSMAVTHVISDKDIKQYNLQSLADIIALFVGITTRDDSSFIYVGARGIGRPGDYNSRILFLLDGTRINENLLDAGEFGGEFFVDVELIERVEYTPGASAALYGSNALLGVINIVTKSSASLGDIDASVSFTNDNRKHARFTISHRSESGADSWFSVSQTEHDDIRFAVQNLPPGLLAWQHLNGEKSTRVMLNHQRQGFTFQAAGSKRERDYADSFAFFAQLADPETVEIESSAYMLSVSYDDKLTDDIDFYIRASTHSNNFEREIPIYFPDGSTGFSRPENAGRWSNLDGQLVFLGIDNHEIMFGVDLQRDHRQSFVIRSSIPEENGLGRREDEFRYGAYVQDLWRLSEKLRVQWALRFDNSNSSSKRWSPSISFKYDFAAQQSMILRHSRAYRVANFLERTNNLASGVNRPQDESTEYSEISLMQRWSPSFTSFTSLYYARTDKLIGKPPFFPGYLNSYPIKSIGVEAGVDKRWSNGATMVASMALQETEVQGGLPVQNSPDFIGQLRFSTPLWQPDFTFSVHSRAVSERKTIAGPSPSYTSHDASISWQPNDNLFIALGVRNVFDETILEITDDSLIPFVQRPRQVHLSIRWSWDK